MSQIKAMLETIRQGIEDTSEEYDEVEFREPIFDDHEAAWLALEERIGQPFPPEFAEFYQRCDGFVDARFTHMYGLEGFLARVHRELDKDEPFFLTIVGDGLGLDDKCIYLSLGRHFKDGQPRFFYEDYVWEFDEEECLGFRDSILDEWREEFDAELPLWHDGLGEAVDKEDADRVIYGPVTLPQLLAYIIDTLKQY